MSARDDILARLGGAGDDAAMRAGAAALLVGPERPAVDRAALEETFLARLDLASVAATSAAIDDLAQLPQAVADYCAQHGLPPVVYLPPDPRFGRADWSGFTLHDRAAPDEAVVVAIARCGVAETGSLVFETGPTAPMLPNFLGLHHIVLVPRIVAHLEDAAFPDTAPRAHYWVTGVSGTTDIEGSYVRGAHGPRFLHVIRMRQIVQD